jgi:Do/DeqQ family serine protease
LSQSVNKFLVGSVALLSLGILGHGPIKSSVPITPAAVASDPGLQSDIDLLSRMDTAYEHVAASVRPAIVSIQTTSVVQQQDSPMFRDPFFRQFFGQQFGNVPQTQREHALGSGVIVSSDGYIVTNNHVIDHASDIKVEMADNREFKGHVVGTDPQSDVAIIKIDGSHFPTAQLGDSKSVRVGDMVMAIGNPFGLNFTITRGSVSAVGRSGLNIEQYENFIQTDAAINPGNSGGALVNSHGQVIGINTAILSNGGMGGQGGFQGVGFAIPSNTIKQEMGSLIRTGHVNRGYLGVELQEITPELATQFHVEERGGALIAQVEPGSPAAQAGLKAGDVIRTFNGHAVDSASSLQYAVADAGPHTTASVGLLRHGRSVIVDVHLAERPARVSHVQQQGDEEGQP